MSSVTEIVIGASLTQASALPLTTIFTPPSDCTAASAWASTLWAGNQVAYQLDSGALSSTCYPSQYSQRQVGSESLWYSPGVCPLSYEYVATSIDTGTAGAETTFAVCCPYGVSSQGSQWSCNQVLTTSNAQLSFENTPSTTQPSTTAFANPISVAWQASDLSLFTPASAPVIALKNAGISIPTASSSSSASSTSSSTSSAASTTSSSTSASTPQQQSGLSSGAAAGVGVGATVAGLALIGGAAWYFWRRRSLKRRPTLDQSLGQQPEEKGPGIPQHPVEADGAILMRHEADSTPYRAELYGVGAESDGTSMQKEENVERAELDAGYQGTEAGRGLRSPT